MISTIRKISTVFSILVLTLASVSVQAATFSISPTSKEFVEGCHSSVDIMIDTNGVDSNAADIEISYNPAQITIVDGDANIAGKQIKKGTAYETYLGNQVDESTGIIRLAAMSIMNPFNGNAKFATIQFKSKVDIKTTDISIRFTGVGDTLDSNIAEFTTSDDILTGVTNGSFTFRTGPCFPDSQKPSIQFLNPSSSSDTMEEINTAGGKFIVRVLDSGDGVDLDTVVITINGVKYYPTDSDVEVSGDKGSYTFKITLRDGLPNDKPSEITVEVSDFTGNKAKRKLVFNTPEIVCPELEECTCGDEEVKTMVQVINSSPVTENIMKSDIMQKFMKVTGSAAFPLMWLIFLIIGFILGWLGKSYYRRIKDSADRKDRDGNNFKKNKKVNIK